MKGKLVSFIIPTYNAEKTIDRCLESVVNQTYENLEIICCDDCSTDGTWNKLKEWAEKDSRIKIIKNEKNMRAAYTRNQCIKVAGGGYYAQLDDDDYCSSDRVEKQVAFLNAHDEYAFVGTGIWFFDESGIYGGSKASEGREVKKEDFLWGINFANPSLMFRSNAIQEVNGYRVHKDTRRSQDYDLIMRLYTAGYRGYILPDKLTFYYRGKNFYPKCKYEYRIDEMKIRYRNFKALGLLPKGLPYVIKPLIVGLIPISFIEKIKHLK